MNTYKLLKANLSRLHFLILLGENLNYNNNLNCIIIEKRIGKMRFSLRSRY